MTGSSPFAGTHLHKPRRGAEGGWKGLDAGDIPTPSLLSWECTAFPGDAPWRRVSEKQLLRQSLEIELPIAQGSAQAMSNSGLHWPLVISRYSKIL